MVHHVRHDAAQSWKPYYFFLLRCHLDIESCNKPQWKSLWLSLRPSFLQLPNALPNKGAGMSGFHDANEVKTWLCVNWQPRSSSWSAASFSSGSESDPPPAFIQRHSLLCPGMSRALSSSHNPCWSGEVGCRGKFGANPQGSEYYPKPAHPHLPPPLLFHGATTLSSTQSLRFSRRSPTHMDKEGYMWPPFLLSHKKSETLSLWFIIP